MSHQETATLEFASACRAMLDDAERHVRDSLADCDAIERGSSKVLDRGIADMIADLRGSAEGMLTAIAGMRSTVGETAYREQVGRIREFTSGVNVVNMRAGALRSAVDAAFQEQMAVRDSREQLIAGIEDERVRTMARLLSRNRTHSALSFGELLELAEVRVDPSKRVSRRLVSDTVSDIHRMMREEKVSEEAMDRVVGAGEDVSPLEMMDAATSEIMDERLRRSAIQAIVRSISARGFVVDRSNIRHIRETDTVRLVAVKPSGQRAEFSIDLHGRFMYHFQGYEGSACEKDIGPLERDLEEVYGIRLTDRQTVWSNPDRMAARHHMETKVRRDSRCR